MKRTEMDRRDRDLKKKQKKLERLENKVNKTDDISSSLNSLFEQFQYDDEEIFNINHNEKILEILMDLKEKTDSKKFEHVLRKTVKKTKVKQKDKALNQMLEMVKDL
ncbi:MAG TPA: hypothetical protein VKS21_02805 [Spirochaetota bacterium]|nr:hypothetical protein [Spirochaetota bacterium]